MTVCYKAANCKIVQNARNCLFFIRNLIFLSTCIIYKDNKEVIYYCNTRTMRNVEIKAKIHNYEKICKLAEQLSSTRPTSFNQDDTFYKVNDGRLKMRFHADSTACLVRYDRDDEGGPKLSNYDLLQFSSNETEKAQRLDKMLKKCLGVRGRVVKERKLYMIGQTRVHIDMVQDLGHFMELEVVLGPEQTVEEGQKIARDLQNKLEVKEEDLIDCAYVDLLDKNV